MRYFYVQYEQEELLKLKTILIWKQECERYFTQDMN